MPKELQRRLKAVDPNLNIIPGGRRKHSTRNKTDWERGAGLLCKSCGREYFRGRDGLCYPCWEQVNEIEIRDNTGITKWLPMNIIKQITHRARKDQQ